MKINPKRIKDQVIVITGASSGIGLTTAEMAAERGARVVLAARSGSELDDIVERIKSRGGRATAVVADVTDIGQVQAIARHALQEYGAIDTWVNNAGVSVYGRTLDVPLEDKRRVFDVNFWGVVHGCETAVPLLRERGGAIINIGSMLSDISIPLQGIYSASKHAVKGYTDSLRMELEKEGAPIAVTLVKPGPIDTPYTQHARNYLPSEPVHPQPVYPPEEVAHAILRCAEKPVREVVVGGMPRLMLAMAALAPRIADLFMERRMFSAQQSDRPRESRDSLFRPSGEDYGRRLARHPRHIVKRSAYTRAVLSDSMRAVPLVLLGAAVAATVVAARR